MPTPILDALDAFFRHEVSYRDTITRLKALDCPSSIIAGLNPPSLIRDLSGEPYKSHRDKQAAKARLEAAAPDLLEAMKKILNKEWLAGCAAVISMTEANTDTLVFSFDPEKKPSDAPEGVMFDLEAAPF